MSQSANERVTKFLQGNKRMYINGQFVESASQKTFETFNPSTGEVLATVYEGGPEDVDFAAKAAREAFDNGPWLKLSAAERSRLMYKLADLMEDHAEELALLETLDNGKPIRESRAVDIPLSIEHLRYYAGWPTKIVGQTIPVSGNYFNYSRHDPIGVVGQIVPWNLPLLMAMYKMGAPLAAGCTIVLKPSELSPLSALYLAELVEEAGFPPGVFNVVPGFGGPVGAPLVEHPLVDKIGFTGSSQTGKIIMQNAAKSLKKVSLELGGKSPNIIMPDADLSKAIPGALHGVMANQGQNCTAGSRVYVHKDHYDKVVSEMANYARSINQGIGMNEDTEMGPLISTAQQNKVLDYVNKGISDGAELLAGGGKPDGNGYFVKPTIFADVDDSMTIAQEEIFGPVLAAIPFNDLDDVIKRANNTPYGLAAGIWTKDLRNAHYMADHIKAGTVWVNCYNVFDVNTPFGGFKESGIGKELGSYGIDNYIDVKSVWISMDE